LQNLFGQQMNALRDCPAMQRLQRDRFHIPASPACLVLNRLVCS
jgi:hypothetical protein